MHLDIRRGEFTRGGEAHHEDKEVTQPLEPTFVDKERTRPLEFQPSDAYAAYKKLIKEMTGKPEEGPREYFAASEREKIIDRLADGLVETANNLYPGQPAEMEQWLATAVLQFEEGEEIGFHKAVAAALHKLETKA